MTRAELIKGLCEAIAKMEGYGTPGTVATRNHNPGNLRSWGNTATADGYATFPSPIAGWEALRVQVTKNIRRGLTTREFFCGKPGVYPGYAPVQDGNHPNNYAEFVAARLGIDPDVPLAEVARIESGAQREEH